MNVIGIEGLVDFWPIKLSSEWWSGVILQKRHFPDNVVPIILNLLWPSGRGRKGKLGLWQWNIAYEYYDLLEATVHESNPTARETYQRHNVDQELNLG